MNNIQHFQSPRHESGVALVMAIIMLVVATLVGMAGIRNTSLQERMAANQFDRAIAMQSAEFAMAQAEKYLYENDRPTVIGNTTKVVNCTTTGTTCEAVPGATFSAAGNNWSDVPLGSFNQDLQAAANAQYHIQYLGLKTSVAQASCVDSGAPRQYGTLECDPDNPGFATMKNAVYLVTARSSVPDNTSDRSVVALSALIKSN